LRAPFVSFVVRFSPQCERGSRVPSSLRFSGCVFAKHRRQTHMLLSIDNFDYTAALDLSTPPKIARKLNRPSTAHFALAITGLPAPVSNARVIFTRADGAKLFTGYLDSAPKRRYLGWGERGPVYLLECSAT